MTRSMSSTSPKTIFEIEGKFDSERVVEGAVIPLMTSEGQRINGSVVEVKDDVVVMDMNHPLAGCDLNFVGEITENRPATNDELSETGTHDERWRMQRRMRWRMQLRRL